LKRDAQGSWALAEKGDEEKNKSADVPALHRLKNSNERMMRWCCAALARL